MAVMLVRALGYDELAGMGAGAGLQKSLCRRNGREVPRHPGPHYLSSDFGIIGGTTPTTFEPEGLATREQAAAMMIRLYDKNQAKIKELHGFYAFSSYSQKDVIPSLDSVSGGWSRLEYWNRLGGAYLNMTADNGNAGPFPKAPTP
jgi:hypothetical protein